MLIIEVLVEAYTSVPFHLKKRRTKQEAPTEILSKHVSRWVTSVPKPPEEKRRDAEEELCRSSYRGGDLGTEADLGPF